MAAMTAAVFFLRFARLSGINMVFLREDLARTAYQVVIRKVSWSLLTRRGTAPEAV